jgi:hypothetical protein
MKLQSYVGMLCCLSLVGCVGVRAPDIGATQWSGREENRLVANIQSSSLELTVGWLSRAERKDASGSFAYRKQSGSYHYSERGYFVVDPEWRPGRNYVGFLKEGPVFCVANPEQQGSEVGNRVSGMTTVSYYTIYDYCAPLYRP